MNTRILLAAGALALSAAVGHAATAAENWENNCAKCHGADGKGQTKIGKKLGVKDYTDAKVQAQLTDEDMLKAITDGVKENGKEKMKPFKDDLSEEERRDLIGYIRKLKA